MDIGTINFLRIRIVGIRQDFDKRHGGTYSVKRKALKDTLRARQNGLCYFCGEPLGAIEHIGHLTSVKHCAVRAGSDKEACDMANGDTNLSLVHPDCNSFVGCDDMECGILQ